VLTLPQERRQQRRACLALLTLVGLSRALVGCQIQTMQDPMTQLRPAPPKPPQVAVDGTALSPTYTRWSDGAPHEQTLPGRVDDLVRIPSAGQVLEIDLQTSSRPDDAVVVAHTEVDAEGAPVAGKSVEMTCLPGSRTGCSVGAVDDHLRFSVRLPEHTIAFSVHVAYVSAQLDDSSGLTLLEASWNGALNEGS